MYTYIYIYITTCTIKLSPEAVGNAKLSVPEIQLADSQSALRAHDTWKCKSVYTHDQTHTLAHANIFLLVRSGFRRLLVAARVWMCVFMYVFIYVCVCLCVRVCWRVCPKAKSVSGRSHVQYYLSAVVIADTAPYWSRSPCDLGSIASRYSKAASPHTHTHAHTSAYTESSVGHCLFFFHITFSLCMCFN